MNSGLQSAQTKIIRAMEQRLVIADLLAAYGKREPYRRIAHGDGRVTLEITEPPPIEISVIAGEVIYQLRSALDHIFFAVVRQNYPSGNVPDAIRTTCQFPLYSKPPGDPLKKPPIPKVSFKNMDCIPEEAFAIIQCLQPYNRRHQGHDLLDMLRTFSNIDKHRHLNTTVTRIDRRHTIKGEGGLVSTVVHMMLNNGEELYEPMHLNDLHKSAIETSDEYVVRVAFDEPEYGPPQTALIEHVIYDLPTYVFRISTFFNKFFAPAPANENQSASGGRHVGARSARPKKVKLSATISYMGVQLIKTGASIALGEPLKVYPDKILCDRCDQSYVFHYSAAEEHRLKEWLPKAKAAVNRSHASNHPDTLAVPF